MLRKIPSTIPSIVLVALALSGQISPARAQHAQFQVYGTEQGLESLAVRGVGEDEQGFLWVATEAGLYRFDGSEFQAAGAEAGAPQEPITLLFRSSTGHLWAIAAQNLMYEDKGIFHPVDVKGLADTPIRLNQIVELDGGEIVIRTGDRYSSVRMRGQGNGSTEWVVEDFASAHPDFPRDVHVNAMIQTRGGIWMGCEGGLCRWSAGRLIRVGKDEGVPRDSYRTLLQTRSGEVWARGQSHLLRLMPGSSRWSDVTGPLASEGLDCQLPALAEDQHGRVLAVLGRNLAIHTENGWRVFSERDGMPGAEIFSTYVDPTGGIWLGLQGSGVARWKGYGQWENYTEADGLPSHAVWGLASDGAGGLLAGTDAGLVQLPAGQVRFRPVAGVANLHGSVYAVARTPDGSSWFLLHSQLYRLRRGARQPEQYQLPGDSVTLLASGSDLWISNAKGLLVFHTNERNAHPEPFSPMSGHLVRQLASGQNGEIWASGTEGVYRVDPLRSTAVLTLPAANYSRMDTLEMDHNGTLWVAVEQGGVIRVRFEGDNVKAVDHIARPILHSRQVNQILEDRRGWLWLSGDQGVDVLHDGKWSALNAHSGLVWDDTDEQSLMEDGDGSIWIGTSEGLSHLLDPQKALQARSYAVQIFSVSVGGHLMPPVSPLKISSGNSIIEIRAGTSTHEDQADLRLMYNLPGYLDGWKALKDGSIRMAQSTPRHVFIQFQLFDDSGRAYSALQSLEIEVSPQWWRSKSAFVFYGLVLVGLVTLGWRWRMRVLFEHQRHLEELVAKRTNELAEKNAALEMIQQELEHKATHDALTGLLNRAAFLEILDREISRCRRERRPLVAAILDLDHFKRINDSYGHQVGDDVLVGTGGCLRAVLREYDVTGRYGGEEFVLLLPGLEMQEAEARLDKIRREIASQSYTVEGRHVQVTASFGFAIPRGDDTVRTLMARADKALYRAKAEGRNRVCFED
jgi:diguanylate cyclase (GGDEF)-like protein